MLLKTKRGLRPATTMCLKEYPILVDIYSHLPRNPGFFLSKTLEVKQGNAYKRSTERFIYMVLQK
jgi:hypothetical protein